MEEKEEKEGLVVGVRVVAAQEGVGMVGEVALVVARARVVEVASTVVEEREMVAAVRENVAVVEVRVVEEEKAREAMVP